MMDPTLEVRDLETGAAAWLIVRRVAEVTCLSVALRPGGDVAVVLADPEVVELVAALTRASSTEVPRPQGEPGEEPDAASMRIKDVDGQDTNLLIRTENGNIHVQISLLPEESFGIYDITISPEDCRRLVQQLEAPMT